MWESCTLAFPYAVNRVIHDSIACYAHFHNASFVPPGVGLSALGKTMSGKILLVDDEQEIADLIEVFLQNEQFQCFKYYTFQDAFSVALCWSAFFRRYAASRSVSSGVRSAPVFSTAISSFMFKGACKGAV